MSKAVGRYKSQSNKNVKHSVSIHDDGIIRCSCVGYRTRKKCIHLTKYLTRIGVINPKKKKDKKATKKSRRKETYRLAVSYNLNDYGWGSLDSAARAIARREEGGAGTGFGMRDLGFWFSTIGGAKSAAKRFAKDGRFTIEGISYEGDDFE